MPPPSTARLTVLNANIESKPKPPLEPVISQQRPDLAVITEAYKARDYLTGVAARNGYRLQQFGTGVGAEGPDIALLIRSGIPIVKHAPMAMTEPWWGPNTGNKRDPRVYVIETLADDALPGDQNWKFVAAHFPPGGPKGGTSQQVHGRNKAAWDESRDRTTDHGNANPWGPFAIVGDLNATHDETKAEIASRIDGGAVVASLGKVDHAVVRGATVKATKLESPVGHGWGVFTLTVTG